MNSSVNMKDPCNAKQNKYLATKTTISFLYVCMVTAKLNK